MRTAADGKASYFICRKGTAWIANELKNRLRTGQLPSLGPPAAPSLSSGQPSQLRALKPFLTGEKLAAHSPVLIGRTGRPPTVAASQRRRSTAAGATHPSTTRYQTGRTAY